MLSALWPWRSRSAPDPQQIDVGILAASGDVVVMYPGEGIPRRYPAALARAIADQVNAHPHVYAAIDGRQPVSRQACSEPPTPGAPAPAPAR